MDLGKFVNWYMLNRIRMNIKEFIAESNKIEGILRDPTEVEIDEFNRFIDLQAVTVDDLIQFAGQPLFTVLAESRAIARQAAQLAGPILHPASANISRSVFPPTV